MHHVAPISGNLQCAEKSPHLPLRRTMKIHTLCVRQDLQLVVRLGSVRASVSHVGRCQVMPSLRMKLQEESRKHGEGADDESFQIIQILGVGESCRHLVASLFECRARAQRHRHRHSRAPSPNPSTSSPARAVANGPLLLLQAPQQLSLRRNFCFISVFGFVLGAC